MKQSRYLIDRHSIKHLAVEFWLTNENEGREETRDYIDRFDSPFEAWQQAQRSMALAHPGDPMGLWASVVEAIEAGHPEYIEWEATQA